MRLGMDSFESTTFPLSSLLQETTKSSSDRNRRTTFGGVNTTGSKCLLFLAVHVILALWQYGAAIRIS